MITIDKAQIVGFVFAVLCGGIGFWILRGFAALLGWGSSRATEVLSYAAIVLAIVATFGGYQLGHWLAT
jgi:hypothetical protein